MRVLSLIAGVAVATAVFAAPQFADTSADVSILQSTFLYITAFQDHLANELDSGVLQACKACEGAVDAARVS